MLTSSPGMESPKHKVLVGTPCYGGLCFCGYVASLIQSKEYLRTKNIQLETCFLTNESLIPRGRNTIVAKFMNDPSFTHLLFIDADITWKPGTIERLLNHDKDIIGAAYPKKGYEWKKLLKVTDQITEPWDAKKEAIIKAKMMNYTVNFSENRQVVNGLLPLKHIGTGYMLIKREVMEKMMAAYPHLKYDDDINILSASENKWLYALFDCIISKETHKTHYLSEDYTFCKRWCDMGGQIYLDVSIPLTHTGTHSFMGNFLASVMFQPQPQPQSQPQAQPQAQPQDLSRSKDLPRSKDLSRSKDLPRSKAQGQSQIQVPPEIRAAASGVQPRIAFDPSNVSKINISQ